MDKKVTKRAVKKTVSEVKKAPQPGYNEFGVCLACNGGNPNCTHNNLAQDGQKLVCVTCGKDMRCGSV